MIFSKLFANRSNWQHKDVNVRVQAIENELNLDNEQERQIVINLAENDESDLVRRSALIKLGDINHWLAFGLQDKHQGIVKFAEKQIVSLFCKASDNAVDVSEHLVLIHEQLSTQLIESIFSTTKMKTLH